LNQRKIEIKINKGKVVSQNYDDAVIKKNGRVEKIKDVVVMLQEPFEWRIRQFYFKFKESK
jgi:hypothetical protein